MCLLEFELKNVWQLVTHKLNFKLSKVINEFMYQQNKYISDKIIY